MAKRKEELKTLLKEENNRAGLKLNIKKETNIMTSSHITAWLIEGENAEAVTFISASCNSLFRLPPPKESSNFIIVSLYIQCLKQHF